MLNSCRRTCDDLSAELNAKKELLESVIESKKELEDLIEQKEEDVRALADENSHYFKNVENQKIKLVNSLLRSRHWRM